MAIVLPGYEEQIGGQPRRVLLRNGEIERFETQYAPFGIFALWDQLFGRGQAPQVRHIRDIVALGLVGGGMSDRAADQLIADQPPSENMALREAARRLLGVTFMPAVMDAAPRKKRDGSAKASAAPGRQDTTSPPASETSAA